MVWAYFTETLAYPYNNQRRVILVLPMVTIWYVVGGCSRWALRWLLAGAHTGPGGRFCGGSGGCAGRRGADGGRIYQGLPVQRGPEELRVRQVPGDDPVQGHRAYQRRGGD